MLYLTTNDIAGVVGEGEVILHLGGDPDGFQEFWHCRKGVKITLLHTETIYDCKELGDDL